MLRRMAGYTAAQYEPDMKMEGNMNTQITHRKFEDLAGKLAGLGITAYALLLVAQVVQSYGLA